MYVLKRATGNQTIRDTRFVVILGLGFVLKHRKEKKGREDCRRCPDKCERGMAEARVSRCL